MVTISNIDVFGVVPYCLVMLKRVHYDFLHTFFGLGYLIIKCKYLSPSSTLIRDTSSRSAMVVFVEYSLINFSKSLESSIPGFTNSIFARLIDNTTCSDFNRKF